MPDLKDVIKSPFGLLAEGAINLIDQFVEDKDAKQRARHEMEKLRHQADIEVKLAQIKVNMQEAKHPSIFVAGWRPMVGWCCVAMLLYSWVLRDLLLIMLGLWAPEYVKALPPRIEDMSTIIWVLGAMLGVSVPRTIEKVKGVARENLL